MPSNPTPTPRDVLRYRLIDRGSVLGTRRDGTETAQHLRRIYDGKADIILDFEGVYAASMPFLTQLLAELSEILTSSQNDGGPIVAAANVDDDVLLDLEAVLLRRRSPMAIIRADEVELLSASPQLVMTLKAAREFPATFTVNDLAKRLSTNPTAVNERLKPLLTAGVLSREADPEAQHGVRYKYRAPHPHLLVRG